MQILVVEDERKTAAFVRKALEAEGFTVTICADGDTALAAATATAFDGMVLDIMLPGRDGLSVLRQLRAQGNRTPVLLLSARGEVNDRVMGLNAGAEDYLPKPFVTAELVARVRALSRRGGEPKTTELRLADLVLDTISHRAQRGGRVFELTAREFRLLEHLMRSAGQICGRMSILEHVWDYHFDPGTNLVDVYVKRLREKIDDGFEPKLLHTVRGVGYRMKPPAMTIRARLTCWFAAVLTLSLLVMGTGTFMEIAEQLHLAHRRSADERAAEETSEMIIEAGLPAVVLGLLGGWWLMRRALSPVARLTEAVEQIHDHNLAEPHPALRQRR